MSTIDRQAAYRQRKTLARESWYLEVGQTPGEWRSMSASQQAVYVRWRNWYRKRRTLRELLAGDISSPGPSRLPFPHVPSPPKNQPASHRVGEGDHKPYGKKGLYRGIGDNPHEGSGPTIPQGLVAQLVMGAIRPKGGTTRKPYDPVWGRGVVTGVGQKPKKQKGKQVL